MATVSHVYAKCTAGRRHYLQTLFSGTRAECNDFVNQRVAQGLPTHFLVVSALERTPATKKFCDGARFDPVEVCYFD